ncbi:MAG: bifunctional DNA-formamidopyrimidine glycosylase/DNA-(apurinic or apyrimidinic site) lyase [Halanaerobiales bacterium]
MPELPEVESIVNGLKKLIIGSEIKYTIIREKKIIGFPRPEKFKNESQGKKVININRRGKYILINLDNVKEIVIHLRMTGKLLVLPRGKDYNKHTHIIFQLTNSRDLRFNNIRKFGRVYLIDKGDYDKAGGLAELGPEPLSDDFTFLDFVELFEGRTARIKSLLLNQKFIAGLGNIYTDEALFRAGIHPARCADTISESELLKLYKAIREILKLGIKYKGTSFSDYVNALGEAGKFQEKLNVYQKEGEKCPVCGSIIEKEKLSGRSSHYCPECQK